MRDFIQYLDTLGTVNIAVALAGLFVAVWVLGRVFNRPTTHEQQVAERREHARRIVNRDIERRERMRLSEINRAYENDPFRWN